MLCWKEEGLGEVANLNWVVREGLTKMMRCVNRDLEEVRG